MASVHDVAAAILNRQGAMSAMKLQKLVYYAHAWHLVWEDRPLFSNPIEAWANGPVVYELYDRHRGRFLVDDWSLGDPSRLDDGERSTVDAVLDFYGDKSAAWLSELTHSEDPWLKARKGLAPGERGDESISDADMAEYYSSLL